MYWSEYGFIERAQMDGSYRKKVAVLITSYGYTYDARGMALDTEQNRIYFVSYYLSSLRYVDLDSAGNGVVHELFTDYDYLWVPRAVAIDDQFVYWNDWWEEKVFRINKTAFDGRLDVIATGLYSPRGMVIKQGNPQRVRKCYFLYNNQNFINTNFALLTRFWLCIFLQAIFLTCCVFAYVNILGFNVIPIHCFIAFDLYAFYYVFANNCFQ